MADAGAKESRRGRKRLRYEEQWVKKKRKLAKDKGASYATYKGEQKPAKELASLTCRCPYRCSTDINDEDRQRIFQEFYQLGDHDSQNKYLYGLISSVGIKRHTCGSTRPRNHTIVYKVRLADGSPRQVCKKSFCDIHVIGKRRVEKLVDKLSVGVLITSDMRGKHGNRPNAISDEAKEKIRDHIKSFPHRQSHYSRASNIKRQYLDGGLSISRMYLLFQEKYEPQVRESGYKPEVKEWLYRKIFNEEFNLSFGYPRSDTCETCDLLNVAIRGCMHEENRAKLQEELATHQEKASQGYQLLHADAESTKGTRNQAVITFDLMQNLPVPTLTHGSMFYSRQLWVYNFGIHNATTGAADMYMWNEAIASRGADEVCSCIKEYLDALPSQIKTLTFFSDNCFGQNKNFQMLCFWNMQVLSRFKQVDHKFLVRGHTYLPNDRDFAHIEKRKDSARVYIPTDWEKVVHEARPKKPFNVISMDSPKFLNFTEITKQFTHRKKDSNGKPVLISKALWMNFGQGQDICGSVKNHPNEVWLRYSYDPDEPWSKVSLLKGRKKSPPSTKISVPEKYPKGHSIKQKKLDDLQKMIPFLPQESRQFYFDLLAKASNTSEELDQSSDSE